MFLIIAAVHTDFAKTSAVLFIFHEIVLDFAFFLLRQDFLDFFRVCGNGEFPYPFPVANFRKVYRRFAVQAAVNEPAKLHTRFIL